MDGLSNNTYLNSAIALETSSICETPFHKLETLSQKIRSLQRHFLQLMSREITNDQQLITLLTKGSSEQRTAAMLLSLSSRNKRRQLSSTELLLPMSRTDLGNYLGLTIETVSRTFSRLQKNNVISSDRRLIRILKFDQLKSIAAS